MEESKPSRTALRVAISRARHQALDCPVVFEDPLALAILGPEGPQMLQRVGDDKVEARIDPRLRASVAARSLLAEEELARATGKGVDQYVLLGAGLDTFAWRNSYPVDSLKLFEVDHPATQAWKRELLAGAGLLLPGNLTFTPVDFERQTLEEGLRAAGFDPRRPAFFSWLGVTPYLAEEAIYTTLGFIGGSASGSAVVFDYMPDPLLFDEEQRRAFDFLSKRVASAGEPWKASFIPAELCAKLKALGFTRVADLAPTDLNKRYFAGRSDGLGVGGLSHLMVAEV